MMTHERITVELPFPSNYVEVYGSKMHFIETGEGDPILFLHGIPTSCYVWRNIMPYLAPLGRCIAIDLIGFGKSDKPDIEYSVFDHIKYVEKFIDTLKLKKITLVMHGWGAVIGLDYAMRYSKQCKGLVFYEAFLRSLGNSDISLPYQEQLITLQNQDNADDLVFDGASFIDQIIPQTVMKTLSAQEMDYYREPFLKQKTGKPILQYLNELPKGDTTTKVDALIANYSKKLTLSNLPKLMLYSIPGFITTIATVMWAKENLPNLEIIEIGEELHLAQETYPQLMGKTISVWMQGIEQANDY